jgi:hypothetical protein
VAAVSEKVVRGPSIARVLALQHDNAADCLVLDTACQKTVTGFLWMNRFAKAISPQKLPLLGAAERESFQFGEGDVQVSQVRYRLPCGIAGVAVEIRCSVVGGAKSNTLPCLASEPLLAELGMVLDLAQGLVWMKNVSSDPIRVRRTQSGHLCIPLNQYPDSGYPDHSLEDDGSECHIFSEHRETVVAAFLPPRS